MIKSMTGFSKSEAKEQGVTAVVELKALNSRYLDINCRLPKYLSHKELDVRDIIKQFLIRGSVTVNISIEADESLMPFFIDENAAQNIYKKLNSLKHKLKLKETVKLDHLLQFSTYFQQMEEEENVELFWRVAKKALNQALRNVDNMRKKEGGQLARDLNNRMNNIQKDVDKIEGLGIERVPEERERLRMRLAQLFESDEIDEQRLQTEMVLMADKLDISEECVRLNSHIKFFFETLKSKESSGKKLNFLLQEMNREINTIGSKANDANISQVVVNVKEELEKIREQVQNIE